MSPRATLESSGAADPDVEAFLLHCAAQGRRPHTVAHYRSVLRRFVRLHPNRAMDKFTLDDVTTYLAPLTELQQAQTASVLRSWFRWGETSGRIKDDPTRLLPKFKWKRAGAVRKVFTEDEIQKLEKLPYPHGVLMEILFETGIKTLEARTLTAKCCELDGKSPQLRISESRYPRVIPITDADFRYRLAHYITNEHLQPGDHLWFSRPGGGRTIKRDTTISTGTIQKWWASQLEAAGVEYRTLRTARNTFARRMRQKGVDLDHLQLLMGHNDYYTTSEYYADERYEGAEKLIRSVADAEAEARRLRELLQRALPHIVSHNSPEAATLAREIGTQLTKQTS